MQAIVKTKAKNSLFQFIGLLLYLKLRQEVRATTDFNYVQLLLNKGCSLLSLRLRRLNESHKFSLSD